MKKVLLGFIAGVIACTMLAFGIPALADSVSKTAEIYYKDIKIYIDGSEVVPKDANGKVVEPFIMDGTTYLPVRAISSALGLQVEWDAATNSAKLCTEEYAEATKNTIPDNPVIEAVHYEKNVINSSIAIAVGADYSNWKHTVSLPSVNVQTDKAQAFNKKIYDTFSDIIDCLKNNEEDNVMYTIKYEYKEYNGVVGILVDETWAAQAGGVSGDCYMFYYDINSDKELTFEEYLSALGVKLSALESALKSMPDYDADDPIEINGGMLDENGSIICGTYVYGMPGTTYFELSKSVL